MHLILASQSPRRRELLALMGLTFDIVVSEADETAPEGIGPGELVEHLAFIKAQAVLLQYPDACIVGADTIVYINGEVLGKPRDDADAAHILWQLQGRTHTVYTGVAVLKSGYCDIRHDQTEVTFAPMSQNEIDWYVSTGEPRDKAGAYGIQGPGGMFVDRVDGNYFTVIGMPLPLLYRMLQAAGQINL